MPTAKFIADYLKRLFTCLRVMYAVLVGSAFHAIYAITSLYFYGTSDMSQHNVILFFLAVIGMVTFKGVIIAFPIMAFGVASLNSILFSLRLDNYYTVDIIPLGLFATVVSLWVATNLTSAITFMWYGLLCSHYYWHIIKKSGLTSQSTTRLAAPDALPRAGY